MDSRGEASRGLWPRRTACALCAGAILLGALLSVGCTASVGGEMVYGYPVYPVEVAPVEITTYPRVYYHGDYAYLAEDRWYYRGPVGWVVFREEPHELYRYRTTLPPDHRARRAPAPRVYPSAPRVYPSAPQQQYRRYYPR
jgi:hypothetical protein